MKALVLKFITWLVGLFIHEGVEQVKEEATKPETITHETTPPAVADKFSDNYQQWLREKRDSAEQQK